MFEVLENDVNKSLQSTHVVNSNKIKNIYLILLKQCMKLQKFSTMRIVFLRDVVNGIWLYLVEIKFENICILRKKKFCSEL